VSGAQIVREVVQALAPAAAPPSSASLELAVAVGEGGLDVRFAAPRPRPAALERAAAALLAATAARLPEALRDRLAVEVGEVRSRLAGTGSAAPLFVRGYSLATCRGVVLGLGGAGADPFAGPWSGVVSPEELHPGLPVVLEPSAVLALVCFALEVASGDAGGRDAAPLPGGLTVVDTAASPYPPQHHPFEADGAPSPDRPLIEEGRWRHRDAHRGGDVDPLFFLLTRPDRALRPLAAATHFSRRNLAVRCRRAVPLPAPAVLIESWRVRVGPRSGAVPFHADLSLRTDDGRRLAVPTVLGLHLDPWEILRRILGACGPAVPALEEDPIEGDGYGEAPPLATDLSLGDLLPPSAGGS
jgi:hypothetical protein